MQRTNSPGRRSSETHSSGGWRPAAGNHRNDVYLSLSQKRYRTPDYANSVSVALHSTFSCEYTYMYILGHKETIRELGPNRIYPAF